MESGSGALQVRRHNGVREPGALTAAALGLGQANLDFAKARLNRPTWKVPVLRYDRTYFQNPLDLHFRSWYLYSQRILLLSGIGRWIRQSFNPLSLPHDLFCEES